MPALGSWSLVFGPRRGCWGAVANFVFDRFLRWRIFSDKILRRRFRLNPNPFPCASHLHLTFSATAGRLPALKFFVQLFFSLTEFFRKKSDAAFVNRWPKAFQPFFVALPAPGRHFSPLPVDVEVWTAFGTIFYWKKKYKSVKRRPKRWF